jgi:hypothetical protein
MFSNFGDFHVYKDTKKSCILNFYYFDKTYVEEKSPQAFIEQMSTPENMDKYKIETICSYDKAPKFVAHNHLE